MTFVLLLALLTTASSSPACISHGELPDKYWHCDSKLNAAVHKKSDIAFPSVIGDFSLYEVSNLNKAPKSFGVSYFTEKQGGVRVVVMFFHRSLYGDHSAEELSRLWLTSQAREIARKHNIPEDSTLSGLAFDLNLGSKTVAAYTTVEPPSTPDSDETILWVAAAYGDYLIGCGTTYHANSVSKMNAALIVNNILPAFKWPATGKP